MPNVIQRFNIRTKHDSLPVPSFHIRVRWRLHWPHRSQWGCTRPIRSRNAPYCLPTGPPLSLSLNEQSSKDLHSLLARKPVHIWTFYLRLPLVVPLQNWNTLNVGKYCNCKWPICSFKFVSVFGSGRLLGYRLKVTVGLGYRLKVIVKIYNWRSWMLYLMIHHLCIQLVWVFFLVIIVYSIRCIRLSLDLDKRNLSELSSILNYYLDSPSIGVNCSC